MAADLAFICPGCRTRLRLAAEAMGKAVRCPKCSFSFRARLKTPGTTPASAPVEGSGRSVVAPALVSAANGPLSSGDSGEPIVASVASGSTSSSLPAVEPPQAQPLSGRSRAVPTAPIPPAAAPAAHPGPSAANQFDPYEGRQLGQYKLLRRLGRGAKGIVYEAEDVLLARRVAVKLLAPEVMAGGPEAIQRFLLEARAASKLDHPNCVGVFNIGKEDGVVFFSMPIIKGGSALDILEAKGAFSALDATRVVRFAALGLGAAHKLGIVHRDVKPGNIMIGDNGEVKVADFGMAKVTDNAIASLTEPGRWLGTPHYMSPEQCQGLPVDFRADVYSLGATYYCLLAGKPPFSDINPMAVVYKQVSDTHPDPRTINGSIPGICVRIIDRAMSKAPQYRYQSAEEMAAALQVVEQSLEQAASIHEDAEKQWNGQTEGLHDSVLGTLLGDAHLRGRRKSRETEPVEQSEEEEAQDAAEQQRLEPQVYTPSGSGRRDPITGDDVGLGSSSGLGLPPAPPIPMPGSARGLSGRFAPVTEPEWMEMPATVTVKFRFASAQLAKDGWKFLTHESRRALKPQIDHSMHRGQKVAVLQVTMCQTPPEELRIIKALICARGEFLGVTTDEKPVGEWLKKQVGFVRAS